jgi:succinate dehydrogenase / fumarate reductase, cytochrome b subunit
MALTGIFLIVFLVVHCYINAQIFYMDGGEKFKEAAHFMGTNFVIRTVEIGLFAFLIWHIVQGLGLATKNRGRRVAYEVKAGNATSKWYSRSMALLGTLILLFLIVHLYNFWIPNRMFNLTGGNFSSMSPESNGGELNLYDGMKAEFKNVFIVILYLLGCFSLGWHLVHGFYSAFQTLGLGTKKYKTLIKIIGIAFSIIVPFIFALMPIAMYFDLVK